MAVSACNIRAQRGWVCPNGICHVSGTLCTHKGRVMGWGSLKVDVNGNEEQYQLYRHI